MTRITLLAAAAAVATAFASPALAQDTAATETFQGGRIGVNLGFADEDIFGTEAFTYGVEAGYDFDLGSAVAGVSAEIQDSDDTGREIAVTGRIGGKVAPTVLVYALAGYTNIEPCCDVDLDGVRIGAGAEIAIGGKGFVKVEQRYSNYELDFDGYQTLIGAGIRF